MRSRLAGVLALGALACAPAAAKTRPAAPAAPASAQQQGAKSPYKKFSELTEGATAREGFFDSYEKDGKLYLAVPAARLGEEFLLTTEIAQGIGARSLFGGTMLNIFEGQVVSIERRGEKAYLLAHPTRFTAEKGSPMEKTVELTFAESVLESSKIESFRDDSALVVDVTDWFVSDLSDIGARMRFAVAPRPGQPGRATLDKSRSYLESVKAFPKNVNIRAKLTFLPGEPVNINSVPDSRYIPVSIFYSFAELPAEPMTPRVADDRMGFFLTARKDFSSTGETFFQRYVNRWRLECGEERAGDLCVPKKPLVYYLDPNIPEEYRPYVMAGVNKWASAFEAAGFKDAIRAEMLPEGADAEDIRYPTLRWNASDQPGYGAIGPSIVDPRTGEILDADILFEANMIQGFRNNWRTVVSPAAAVEAMLGFSETDAAALAAGGEASTFGPTLEAQGALLRTMLVANGEIEPNEAVPSEMVGQAITWVTLHEVGHTLGLRHNFRSSVDTPLDKLQDRSFVEANGVFSSVMEYPSINLAPKGKGAGVYYNTGVGTSDRWVIAYGYTPDAERAKTLARQAAQPGHAFGTDEDAGGPGAMDPMISVFDLGADPLAWGKERAALIASMIPTLPERVLVDDARYGQLTDALQTLLGQYGQAVATSVKYLGGQYTSRDHVGDPDGRPPFAPVPRAKQLEALDFLATSGFGERAFFVPREVFAQLGANRWSHWGQTNTFNGRIDYPMHESVLGAQRTLLMRVTDPFVFARIRDAETKFGTAQVVTIPELMSRLTSAVWSEVTTGGARSIPAQRRDLQRVWLDRVGTLVIGDVERLPADARAVARAELVSLRRRIDARRAAGGFDAYTRAHLAESSDRIEAILDAGLEAK
ncbi:MAG TPA: zinc-dependent metalloprotease [Gemmatimonadaceae bacterium]